MRSELNGPILARRGWGWSIGSAYAGVFIWVPFLDRLGTGLLGETSLGWLLAWAVLATIACHALLYSIPALWGWKAGHRLGVVGASTFGATGSEWITGILVGLGSLLWLAVSIALSIRLTMLGLISCGLISPGDVGIRTLGSLSVESTPVLLTAVFWIVILAATSGLRIVGVIIALMQVYTPVALTLLGLTALWVSPGLASFAANKAAALAHTPELRPATQVGPEIFQLVFGYFAVSGLMAVEWGMAVRERRDVRIGGWIAIVLSGSFCSVMAILTVAGSLANRWPTSEPPPWPLLLTFQGSLFLGIGGIPGGILLMSFGLATLAPGCYAASVLSRRLAAYVPRLGGFTGIMIAAIPVFPLIATSWATHLEEIFSLSGALFAPAVGALVADALRQRCRWQGIREGWNGPGLIAWACGVTVGLIPLVSRLVDWPVGLRLSACQLTCFPGIRVDLSATGGPGMGTTDFAASGWSRRHKPTRPCVREWGTPRERSAVIERARRRQSIGKNSRFAIPESADDR